MGVDAGKAGSYAAGLLFAVGWWIFIDGAAYADYHDSRIPFNFLEYLPGILSTLVFFLCVACIRFGWECITNLCSAICNDRLNTLDWEMVVDSPTYSADTAGRARQECASRRWILFFAC
jgi:hypothetical protein